MNSDNGNTWESQRACNNMASIIEMTQNPNFPSCYSVVKCYNDCQTVWIYLLEFFFFVCFTTIDLLRKICIDARASYKCISLT